MAQSPCSSSGSCPVSACRRSSATTRGRAWRCWPMRSTGTRAASSTWSASPARTARRRRRCCSRPSSTRPQRPCGLLGTVERRIGGRREAAGLTTPEAPDLQRALRSMLEAGDEACAMEASSIAIAQRRLVGTEFAAVGFTNLSQDHLDFHGDLETYFATKASLFDGRFPRAVNADDAYGARLEAELRFGVDVRVRRRALRGVRAAPRPHRAVRAHAAGRALARAAPARALQRRQRALRRHAGAAAGRAARRDRARGGGRRAPRRAASSRSRRARTFGVIVDYAHTPGGIAAVLASARPLAGGRLLCVFGAGGDRDHAKRPLMGAAAEAGADRLYVTSDNSRSEPTESIVGQIVGGLERPGDAHVEHDRRRAIGRALADAEAGRSRPDPRQGTRAGPGHRRRGRAVRRSQRGAGAPRSAVIPLAAGALAGTRLLSGDPATRIESVVTDSRAAGPGALFCALEGERADGHDFLDAVPGGGRGRRALPQRPLATARGGVRAGGRRPAHGARRDRAPGAACVGREGDRHRRIEWQDVHEGHARRALRPARADTRHPSQPQQSPRPAVDALPARAASTRSASASWARARSASSPTSRPSRSPRSA